ncbi:MAG: hypothetical protein JRN40_02815, partial [Nitrososphaerota archaeon]|nr:hypothetical protein [Nitrososphaerota archaeon]
MGQTYPKLMRGTPNLGIQYKYVVLINTTIGAFMAVLESNIVLIALPTLTQDLHASPFEAVWIIMGYALVTANL